MKSRTVNWETAYKNKFNTGACSWYFCGACMYISTGKHEEHAHERSLSLSLTLYTPHTHMHALSLSLSLFPGQLCGDYLVHIFFFYTSQFVFIHSFILAEYIKHL
jgi:hypothetical protein